MCGLFGVCVVMFRLVSWFECRRSFRCGWFWTNHSSVGDVVSPALSPFLLAGVALRLVWLTAGVSLRLDCLYGWSVFVAGVALQLLY